MDIHIDDYKNIKILRDDKLLGGTKSRFIEKILDNQKTGYVYATPVYGSFQIALAGVCKKLNKECVIFCANRKKKHAHTLEVEKLGGVLNETLKGGYLNVVQSKAKKFVSDNPTYQYIEFGGNYDFGIDIISQTMKQVIKKLGKEPDEIYCAVGSGTLVKGILKGTKNAKITGVIVGKDFNFQHERLNLIKYPKKFENISRCKVPFQCMPNYDLKAFEICLERLGEHHNNDVLFWNVY